MLLSMICPVRCFVAQCARRWNKTGKRARSASNNAFVLDAVRFPDINVVVMLFDVGGYTEALVMFVMLPGLLHLLIRRCTHTT